MHSKILIYFLLYSVEIMRDQDILLNLKNARVYQHNNKRMFKKTLTLKCVYMKATI